MRRAWRYLTAEMPVQRLLYRALLLSVFVNLLVILRDVIIGR